MNLLIRKATIQDEPMISVLETLLFSHTYFKDYLDTFLSNQSVLVAVDDGNIIGVIGWFQQDETAEIIMIGVDKEYRRRTIGSMLLKACISVLLNKSIHSVFVEVRESNDPAKQLYQSLRFTLNRTRVSYYNDPNENALEMRLDL